MTTTTSTQRVESSSCHSVMVLSVLLLPAKQDGLLDRMPASCFLTLFGLCCMFRLWFGHLFYCSGVCHGYFAPPLVGIMLLSGYAIKLCYRAVFIAGINTQGKHGHTVVSLSGLHPVG